jgi:hypothetical protein
MDELRLFGLAGKGSILLVSVGLIAIFFVALVRHINLMQTDKINSKGGYFMRQKTNLKCIFSQIKLLEIALLETIWAIETNLVAGALPA